MAEYNHSVGELFNGTIARNSQREVAAQIKGFEGKGILPKVSGGSEARLEDKEASPEQQEYILRPTTELGY